ncbi:MAG: hypothetical protein H6738_07355 [Alphaproteobacteria bacterium]|nr:hypothetical protein [Alphaproteobacteria bacterium]MCB9696580.1 hypothetical protein [Alphaproteobacteria bacterium]
MTVLLLSLLCAAHAEDTPGIVIEKVGDIYPVLPPPGATRWNPQPLLDAIKASTGTFTPKDVYELIDHEVRPDVVSAVAAKAALFYDPNNMVALSVQQQRARGGAMKQTVTLDGTNFAQLFETFSDYRNELTAADGRVAALGERRADESQSMYERRARAREEQLVKVRGPFEGRIGSTTFVITLPATVEERDGCSRAVAAWNANAIDFDLFRFTMGTTRAASANVALSQSPSIDKAWFVIDAQRRFEVLGKCGTTGSKAKVTMSRTPEGAWSGTAGF